MKKDLYIDRSKIHGKGVFSKKSYKKGQTIFILKGQPKHLRVSGPDESKVGPNWIGMSENEWLDPEPTYQFLNHSCNPNMGIKGKVTFVALRKIKSGEELTFDYSITEDDEYWVFKCKCRAKNCRETVRSVQHLPSKVFNRYLPFIPTHFKRVYNEANGQKV